MKDGLNASSNQTKEKIAVAKAMPTRLGSLQPGHRAFLN
jgi:hypothetical protein